MSTDSPSVNDGISVGGQAASRNDALEWPLTSRDNKLCDIHAVVHDPLADADLAHKAMVTSQRRHIVGFHGGSPVVMHTGDTPSPPGMWIPWWVMAHECRRRDAASSPDGRPRLGMREALGGSVPSSGAPLKRLGARVPRLVPVETTGPPWTVLARTSLRHRRPQSSHRATCLAACLNSGNRIMVLIYISPPAFAND